MSNSLEFILIQFHIQALLSISSLKIWGWVGNEGKMKYTFFNHLRLHLKRLRKQKIAPKVPLNCHANGYFQKGTMTILFTIDDKYIPHMIVIIIRSKR